MAKRVVAAIAVMVGVALLGTAPLAAQTYPPPHNAITVDDPTPVPGQRITVTFQTCRARTVALIGLDLALVATPRVGGNGVATATIRLPSRLAPGRHTVSGACLDPNLAPLFLRTTIVVGAAGPGGHGGGGTGGEGTGGSGGGTSGGGSAAGAPAAGTPAAVPATPGTGAGTTAGAGTASGAGGSGGDLTALDGPGVPADAPAMFEDTAEANGVTPDGGASGAGAAQQAAEPTASGGDDPGPLATVARVVLGVAALAGVPVALAISRRPPRVVREGFA